MKKKLILGIMIVTLIGATAFWFLQSNSNSSSIQSGSPDSQVDEPENAQDLPLSTEEVTVRGEVICLPHKDTSGPQTLECAIGIRDDKGVNYALRADDPSQTGSLTGKKVQVTGRLQEAEPTSRYNTAGTLHVLAIKQL